MLNVQVVVVVLVVVLGSVAGIVFIVGVGALAHGCGVSLCQSMADIGVDRAFL